MNHLNLTLDEAIGYHQSGELTKAQSIYENIIKKEKTNPDAWHLLGVLSYQMNHFDLCVQNIEKAIRLNPNVSSFYSNIGLAYHKKNQFENAIESFKKAINLNPNYPEAFNNLANSLRDSSKDKSQEALKCYKRALELRANYPEALNNLGNLLVENNNYEDAIKYYDLAVNYNPNYGDAYYNIGYLYKKIGKLDRALEFFQKALSLPNLTNEYVLNSIFDVKREMCDWDEIDNLQNTLVKETLDSSSDTLIDPFSVVARLSDCTQKIQYELIKKHTDKIVFKNNHKRFTHKVKKIEKIRVAYVTAGLYDHPIMQNTQGMFPHHDKDKFEIYICSLNHEKDSNYFKNALRDVDGFMDLSHMDDEEAAQKIYDSHIDILVDMQGYNAQGRVNIFSYRPAPVQLQFHAYPGTMGCDFIDYIVTDEIVTPKEEEKSFGEKFLYMPDCYFPTYDKQEVSKLIPSKKECGLSEDAFVFCCFNTAYKIEEKIFSLWMSILKELPDSVLWLYSTNEFVIANLRKKAKELGVNPKRLVFASLLPKAQHISRIKNADIFLDTYYCNAHTTAIDALHADLPIITRKGYSLASRTASSMLLTLGLPELVVDDFDAYKKLAVSLANNKTVFEKINTKLKENKKTTNLFNTKLFVKNLEKGFEMIYSNYQNNKKPKMIKIKSEVCHED